jgi:hypothetical protein
MAAMLRVARLAPRIGDVSRASGVLHPSADDSRYASGVSR